MELKDLKTGFFGYKKDRVCRYISELNSTFGEKLTRQKEESGAIIERIGGKNEELNARVMLLESEKDALRHKNEQLEKTISELSARIDELTGQLRDEKLKCGDISGILLEAKLFADSLRHKAEEENEIFRSENRRLYENEQRRLCEYGKQVSLVKETLLLALRSMDGCLTDMEGKISDLNMSGMFCGSDAERNGDAPAYAPNKNGMHSPVGEQTGDSSECSETRRTSSAVCSSEGADKSPTEGLLCDSAVGSVQNQSESSGNVSDANTDTDASKSLSDIPEKNPRESSGGFLTGKDICGDACDDSHKENRAAIYDIANSQGDVGTAHDGRPSGKSDSIGGNALAGDNGILSDSDILRGDNGSLNDRRLTDCGGTLRNGDNSGENPIFSHNGDNLCGSAQVSRSGGNSGGIGGISNGAVSLSETIPDADGLTYQPSLTLNESGDGSYEKQGA